MAKQTQSQPYKADPTRTSSGFLFPLRLPIVRSEISPLVSRMSKSIRGSVRLPVPTAENGTVVGSFGGPSPQSGFSPIDDLTANLPSNLRVSFTLQQMENEVVSGNGVDIPCWARWELHSTAATQEFQVDGSNLWSLPAPGPGEIWPIPHANGIYDALVGDGCGNTPVFPVEIQSSVGEMADLVSEYVQIGEFAALDENTLRPNGFWTFAYTIRATGTNGGVSDFKFRGIVSVTCTNIESF